MHASGVVKLSMTEDLCDDMLFLRHSGRPRNAAAIHYRVLPATPPPYREPHRRIDVMDGLANLTDGQRDCLRLVYQHMTSKDIARLLDVSPHTVDMRLRTAMRTLAVTSRIEAARLLVLSESETAAYQPLIYQASDVAAVPIDATIGAPASTESDDNAIHDSDPRIRPVVGPPASGPPRLAGVSSSDDIPIGHGSAAFALHGHQPQGLADSRPWGNRNDLTIGARLAWITVIAIGSALGFGAILGALEALNKLL